MTFQNFVRMGHDNKAIAGRLGSRPSIRRLRRGLTLSTPEYTTYRYIPQLALPPSASNITEALKKCRIESHEIPMGMT